MDRGLIFLLAFLFSVIGFVFSINWVKPPSNQKDRSRGVFSMVVCIIMIPLFAWGIIFENSLLWYGQQKENIHVDFSVDPNTFEENSFLYLINKVDNNTSVDDVVNMMGTNYTESFNAGYTMEYRTSKYILNNSNSTFVSFEFNKKKTKILSVKWACQNPTENQFDETLQYLEEKIIGKAENTSTNKADWTGLHLEDTGYFLLFIREF